MGLSQGTGSRLVTKQNTAGEVLLSASLFTNSGSAGSFGSWAQFTASTAAEYAIFAVSVYSVSGLLANQQPAYLEIGYGPGGSETVLGRRRIPFIVNTAMTETLHMNIPWRVAAGVRLAGRVAFATAVNAQFDVDVSVIPWASLEGN